MNNIVIQDEFRLPQGNWVIILEKGDTLRLCENTDIIDFDEIFPLIQHGVYFDLKYYDLYGNPYDFYSVNNSNSLNAKLLDNKDIMIDKVGTGDHSVYISKKDADTIYREVVGDRITITINNVGGDYWTMVIGR